MNDHLRVAIQPEKETDSTERDYSKYTPVMQEYFKLRDENPDSIILFQIGAFYEAMGDDSHTVSQALGLNITTRMIADDEGKKTAVASLLRYCLIVIVSLFNPSLSAGLNTLMLTVRLKTVSNTPTRQCLSVTLKLKALIMSVWRCICIRTATEM